MEYIIHNLKPSDTGFKEVQAYNKLAGNKPIGNMRLSEKLKLQHEWKLECLRLFDAANIAVRKGN